VILLNMVLVERAFSIPGVFQNLNGAIDNGDFPILFALTIEGAIIVCACNVLADLALMAVDPRVRAARAGRRSAGQGGPSRLSAVASAAATSPSGGSSPRSASRPKQTVPS